MSPYSKRNSRYTEARTGPTTVPELTGAIRKCRLCADHFEHPPRPLVQLDSRASIIIAGQAPGSRAHASGIPFDDASGDRLRDWMGISRETFYDARRIALLPMAFCYPGGGVSGDRPPRPECAHAWRQQALDALANRQLILVIGRYAMDWHLTGRKHDSLTETVRAWKDHAPDIIPLPHPSPRNNRWLFRNPWFEAEVLPALKARVDACLNRQIKTPS